MVATPDYRGVVRIRLAGLGRRMAKAIKRPLSIFCGFAGPRGEYSRRVSATIATRPGYTGFWRYHFTKGWRRLRVPAR